MYHQYLQPKASKRLQSPGGLEVSMWEEGMEGMCRTFFMFSASRSYSSNTSCSRGESSSFGRVVVESEGSIAASVSCDELEP